MAERLGVDSCSVDAHLYCTHTPADPRKTLLNSDSSKTHASPKISLYFHAHNVIDPNSSKAVFQIIPVYL